MCDTDVKMSDSADMGDNSDITEVKTVAVENMLVEDGFTVVHVDGSCRENGREGAEASFGVFWGDSHPMNAKRKLGLHEIHTNNRAELQAAIHALQQGKESGIQTLEVRSDSLYLTAGMNDWTMRWKKNGWKKSNGKNVLNKDKWVELYSAKKLFTNVKWTHVSGHTGIWGNEQADALAQEAHQTANGSANHETRLNCQLCPVCDLRAAVGVIQCHDCDSWIHYECSRLPEYQLSKYKNTQRKFSCENCVEVAEEFLNSTLGGGDLVSPQERTQGTNKQIQTEQYIGCDMETQTDEVNDDHQEKEDLNKPVATCTGTNSIEAQAEAMAAIRNLEKCMVEQFTFQTKEIHNLRDQMEKVTADTANEEIQKLKTMNNKLQENLKKAERENMDIKKSIKKNETQQVEEEKLHEEVNSLKNEICVKNLEISQIKQHRVSLSKDNERLEKDNNELSLSMEKKGSMIKDLDEQCTTMTATVVQLREKLVQEKSYASKAVNGTISNQNTNVLNTNTKPSNVNSQSRDVSDSHHGKKQVLLVGDSLVRDISVRGIATAETFVKRTKAYTMDEADKMMEKIPSSEKPDSIIIHVGTNDSVRTDQEAWVPQMRKTVATAKSVGSGKIILSLPMNRGDSVVAANNVKKYRASMYLEFVDDPRVVIVDNQSLSQGGAIDPNLMDRDRIHVNRQGSARLANNIKETLWKVFPEERPRPQQSGHQMQGFRNSGRSVQNANESYMNGRQEWYDGGSREPRTRERGFSTEQPWYIRQNTGRRPNSMGYYQ